MTANNLNIAKQDNPEAIAALMNKSLQPKGITVKATVANQCLSVIAEAKSAAPEQSALVDFVRQGIANLNPRSIEKIIIQGKASNQKQIAWEEVVELKPPVSGVNGTKPKVIVSSVQSEETPNRLAWLTHLRDHANTALLAGILLTLLVNGWNANRPKSVFYEYKVESIKDAVFDSSMQQAGADGWELASARRAISGEGSSSEGLYEVIFKRPITQAQARQNVKDVAAQMKASAIQIQESLAASQIGSINRGQQAYFLENNSFSQSLSSLNLEIENDSVDYIYSVSLDGRSKAIVTAIPKEDGLKSYTGAVALTGRDRTEAIICKSNSPSKTAPAAPSLNGAELQCAAGSVKAD